MSIRRFALVLAVFTATPLLCAFLLTVCPCDVVAVFVCLAMAAGGLLGAVLSYLLLDREARR